MRLALLCFVLPMFAQTARTARIEGRVLNSVTGEPVRKANVRIVTKDRDLETISDAEGRFGIDLDPGPYPILIYREGFMPKRAENSVTLAAGEKVSFEFRIAPLAVISGRVVDSDGDPIPNVTVNALRWNYSQFGRLLGPLRSAQTNDLGEFRIFGLPAGKYQIGARPPEVTQDPRRQAVTQSDGFPPTYYPGTMNPSEAADIQVGPGEHRRGIDITLKKTRLATIRGRVIVPAGATNISVNVVTITGNSTFERNFLPKDEEGRFEIRGIFAGPHPIHALAVVDGKQWSAVTHVNVDSADIDGIELKPVPRFTLKGRMRVETGSDRKYRASNIQLNGSSGVQLVATTSPDGAFSFGNLPADTYRFSIDTTWGLYVKSVRLGDKEISNGHLDLSNGAPDAELDILLSAKGATIEGTIDAKDATVTLVPTGERRTEMFFKAARSSGTFRFEGVAPGTYQLYAWTHVNPDAVLFDPDFTKRFEAVTVEVSENQTKSIELKLIKNAEE